MTDPASPPDLEAALKIATAAFMGGDLADLAWPQEDHDPHYFSMLLGLYRAWRETPDGQQMDPALDALLLEAFETGTRAETALDRPAGAKVNAVLARGLDRPSEPLSATVYGAGVMAQATAAQLLNSGDVHAGLPPSEKQIDLMFANWSASTASGYTADTVDSASAGWQFARRAYEAGMTQSRIILAERLAYLDAITHHRPIEPTVSPRVALAVLGMRGHVVADGEHDRVVYGSWAEPGSFAYKVLDLIFKCDVFNRRLLRRVFPEWVDAVNMYESDYPGFRALAEGPT